MGTLNIMDAEVPYLNFEEENREITSFDPIQKNPARNPKPTFHCLYALYCIGTEMPNLFLSKRGTML